MTPAKKYMFICGEASGDLLAAELISALKKKAPDIHFSGIVGDACKKQDVESLVPLEDIAVMGVTEVFSSLWTIRKAVKKAVKHIQDNKIDVLICVDAFAFTHPIAQRARKANPDLKIVKYIPPKLWAWGDWRVKKLRNVYDLILASLPFEVAFFKQHGIETQFVGHTVIERIPPYDALLQKEFISTYGLDIKQKNILLLPGSRRAEIETLLPLFLSIAKKRPDLHYILPVAQGREGLVKSLLQTHHMNNKITVIFGEEDRFKAFHFAHAALAASGTVSLELMITNTPAIIAYKMSWLTSLLAKALVKVRYASLLNIMLDRIIFPEFLQNDCNHDNLLYGLNRLLSSKTDYHTQLSAFEEGKKLLRPPEGHNRSSDYAAEIILSVQK